jgi:transposase
LGSPGPPQKALSGACRKEPWKYDKELCRERKLIKRAINKLRHWRKIATRYDRRSVYFLSGLYLVSSVDWG